MMEMNMKYDRKSDESKTNKKIESYTMNIYDFIALCILF